MCVREAIKKGSNLEDEAAFVMLLQQLCEATGCFELNAEEDTNACTEFHGNPSNNCWDALFGAKYAERLVAWR